MTRNRIKDVSERRRIQNKEYVRLKREKGLDKPSVRHRCFFCNEHVSGVPDPHHLDGRIEDNLIDDKFLVPAHRKCHMDYHGLSAILLKQKKWYTGFLDRLYDKSDKLWRKEIYKQVKIGVMSIETYIEITDK